MEPHSNHAFEECLFDAAGDDEAVLLLWQNSDAVVIGCNQNPWRECNLPLMAQKSVKLVRRISGGGAVFHDKGNLNFSFMLPQEVFCAKKQLEVIVRALGSFGIPAVDTPRHDICVNGKKISGSAFVHRRKKSLHHGTILFNADTNSLRAYLGFAFDEILGRGVQSERAQVANLADFKSDIKMCELRKAIVSSFLDSYGGAGEIVEIYSFLDMEEKMGLGAASGFHEKLKSLTERNTSWGWLYGKTPDFTLSIRNDFAWGDISTKYVIRKAELISAEFSTNSIPEGLLRNVEKSLVGLPFTGEKIGEKLSFVKANSPNKQVQSKISDIVLWLEQRMSIPK